MVYFTLFETRAFMGKDRVMCKLHLTVSERIQFKDNPKLLGVLSPV